MLSVSDALAAVIGRTGKRRPTCQVLADFDGAGQFEDITRYVGGISIDRALTTDVPVEARLVVGYSAATCTLDLLGDPRDNTRHAAWLWSPYNPASPFYGRRRIGAPVRVLIGFYRDDGAVELVTRFVGKVRTLDVNGGARTARLQAVDGSEYLRSAPSLPMVAASYRDPASGYGVRPGLDGCFVADTLLRQNGFYSSPPPRPLCIVSAPLHGSAMPEVGTLVSAWDGPYVDAAGNPYTDGAALQFGPGAFSEAVVPNSPRSAGGPSVVWNVATLPDFHIGGTAVFDVWANTDVPSDIAVGAPLWTATLRVLWDGGANLARTIIVGMGGDRRPFVKADPLAAPVYTTEPGSSGWVYMQAAITITAADTLSCVWRLNGSTRPTVTATITGTAARYPSPGTSNVTSAAVQLSGLYPTTGSTVDLGAMGAVHDLQVTTESAPAGNYSFVPGAFLEPSKNKLTAMPVVDPGSSTWTILQQLAAAELGVFLFDETGVPRMWNRDHFFTPPATDSQVTVTTARQLKDWTSTEAVDAIKNWVTVAITPYTVQLPSMVYIRDPTSVIGLHSRERKTIVVKFPNPVLGVGTYVGLIPHGGGQTYNGYRACRTSDGKGDAVENVQISVRPYAQFALVDFYNPNRYPVYIVGPAKDQYGTAYPDGSRGVAMLEIYGRNILSASASADSSSAATATSDTQVEAIDQGSVDDFDPQVYAIAASPWLQDADSGQDMANVLVGGLCRPSPTQSNVTVPGDCRLQLGDRMTPVDVHGGVLGIDEWLIGVNERFEAAGSDGVYTMTLAVKPTAAVGELVFDDPTSGFFDSGYSFGGVY